jgi:hypothetical protein
MMNLRKKPVLNHTEHEASKEETLQEVITEQLVDANDAFYDMIDGIYERQRNRTSDFIELSLGLTMINLETASNLYGIFTGTNGRSK